MAKKIGKLTYPNIGTQVEQIKQAFKLIGLEASSDYFEMLVNRINKEHGTIYDCLQYLLEHEISYREDLRISRWTGQSKIPAIKTLEDFDFPFQPSIDRRLINELASCCYIDEGKNVVFLGGVGVGKTHLACALGREAITKGYEVRYMALKEFVAARNRTAESSIPRLFRSLMLPKLLILDDIDYFNPDEESSLFLFNVMMDRLNKGMPMMITSNNNPKAWQPVFGTPQRTAAVLDRLFDTRTKVVFNIDGPSYRRSEVSIKNSATTIDPTKESAPGLLKKLTTALSSKP